MNNIIENLKNFNNIEIILILIVIVILAIIINSKVFKVFLTAVILLLLFLTFYSKVPTFSNLVNKFTSTYSVFQEDDNEVQVTINKTIYDDNEFTIDASTDLEKDYIVLNTEEDLANVEENDVISINYQNKNYEYRVEKITALTNTYANYNLVIVGNIIIYANLT